VIVDVLAEDAAHEGFLRPLIGRLAREVDVRVEVRVRSARGGHPRVIQELDLYQRAIAQGVAGRPDLLVVAIDSNCAPYPRARRSIEREIRTEFRGITVIACPDPHVERWYLADPPSFGQVVGKQPRGGKRKCGRDLYKRRLAEAVAAAGHPVLLGGIEFAEELVASMDLYRAGKTERSLKRFVDDLRAGLTLHR
jgi:hypothetical protein